MDIRNPNPMKTQFSIAISQSVKNTNTREYGTRSMTVEIENPDKEVDDRSGKVEELPRRSLKILERFSTKTSLT